MRKGLLYSLLLHTIVLGLLAYIQSGKGNGPHEAGADKEQKNEKVIPKETQGEDTPREIEVSIIQAPLPLPPKPSPTPSVKECPGGLWYGGIGIQEMMGLIDTVYPGYPAARAGLLAGDVITNREVDIRGLPGTKLTLEILRNGQVMTIVLTREKICIENLP